MRDASISISDDCEVKFDGSERSGVGRGRSRSRDAPPVVVIKSETYYKRKYYKPVPLPRGIVKLSSERKWKIETRDGDDVKITCPSTQRESENIRYA